MATYAMWLPTGEPDAALDGWLRAQRNWTLSGCAPPMVSWLLDGEVPELLFAGRAGPAGDAGVVRWLHELWRRAQTGSGGVLGFLCHEAAALARARACAYHAWFSLGGAAANGFVEIRPARPADHGLPVEAEEIWAGRLWTIGWNDRKELPVLGAHRVSSALPVAQRLLLAPPHGRLASDLVPTFPRLPAGALPGTEAVLIVAESGDAGRPGGRPPRDGQEQQALRWEANARLAEPFLHRPLAIDALMLAADPSVAAALRAGASLDRIGGTCAPGATPVPSRLVLRLPREARSPAGQVLTELCSDDLRTEASLRGATSRALRSDLVAALAQRGAILGSPRPGPRLGVAFDQNVAGEWASERGAWEILDAFSRRLSDEGRAQLRRRVLDPARRTGVPLPFNHVAAMDAAIYHIFPPTTDTVDPGWEAALTVLLSFAGHEQPMGGVRLDPDHLVALYRADEDRYPTLRSPPHGPLTLVWREAPPSIVESTWLWLLPMNSVVRAAPNCLDDPASALDADLVYAE